MKFRRRRRVGYVRRDEPKYRINTWIHAHHLQVVDSDGKSLGVMKAEEALARAREAGLDLVEVAPRAKPPVAKIMDYGRFLYDEKRKQRLAKKKATTSVVHEISLRPHIGEHDLEVKLKKVREFLEKGDKVKFKMYFRGREIVHLDTGKRRMREIMTGLSDLAVVELDVRLEGRSLYSMVRPLRRQ